MLLNVACFSCEHSYIRFKRMNYSPFDILPEIYEHIVKTETQTYCHNNHNIINVL